MRILGFTIGSWAFTLEKQPQTLPRARATTSAGLDAPLSSLWEEPTDLPGRNLFDGQWGQEYAPDPHATYRFVGLRTHGIKPEALVTDPLGRQWHVKRRIHNDSGSEGPVEVVLSRLLAAVGYHQPPVYFLGTFTVMEGSRTRIE